MDAREIRCRRVYTVKCPGTISGDYKVRAVSRPDDKGWLKVRDLELGGIYCTHVSHLSEE